MPDREQVDATRERLVSAGLVCAGLVWAGLADGLAAGLEAAGELELGLF